MHAGPSRSRGPCAGRLHLLLLPVLAVASANVLLVCLGGVVGGLGAVVIDAAAGTLALCRLFAARAKGAAEGKKPDLRPGEYRASSRELFRVEDLCGRRAIVENCGTGDLIDVGLEELAALRPITVQGAGKPADDR